MVGARNLNAYLETKDRNNVKVGDWAVALESGVAECKVCPKTSLNFSKGKLQLTQHSESKKHVKNFKNNPKKQPSIKEVIEAAVNDEKQLDLKNKTKNFEIGLAQFLSRHNIAPSLSTCLVNILKKYVTDSEIIEKMTLGREKCRYLIEFGISEIYEQETINKLRNCDAFGVAMDESEVNKKSEMEVMVNIATETDGLELRHYKTIDIEAGDATTITNSLLDSLTEDKVDYKAKMISGDFDGCSTMQGCRTGVITQLKQQVPQLESLGSSTTHNLANAMMHAVTASDPDMKQAMVDVFMDIGGAKGKGTKKMKECQEMARKIGVEFSPIKKFVSTRFRILRICIKPVLHNWPALVEYYKSVKKPTPRQKRLQSYFVDRQDLTRIKLKFIYAATEELCVAIDFFEQEKVQVHHAREKMEMVLYRQLQKTVKEELINNLDKESNDISRKTGRELLNVDVDENAYLTNKDIFIGQEVEKEIKQLGLKPSSVQLSWLFEIVRSFHKTVVKFLQKYFDTPLKSSVMDNMSALSPHKQSHILTARKLKGLALQYSKVVDNIEPFGGMDSIKEEIDRYVVDDDVKEIEKGHGFEQFWSDVQDITDGEARWQRFPILPRFAFAMAVKHNDTSDVERQFSVMNNIFQDKQRNAMSQDMLDSNMHVRSGVESKHNKKKCPKCAEPEPTPHCHCTLAEVTPEMRQNCVKAWERCKNS